MKKRMAVSVISILTALVIALGGGLCRSYAENSGQENEQAAEPAPTPVRAADWDMIECLKEFFSRWNANSLDGMLELCSGGWQEEQENPRTELFRLMANRTPISLEVQAYSGTEEDPARTVTVIVLMDRNNGKEPKWYQLNVVMEKGTGRNWYVNPSSLVNQEQIGGEPREEATPVPAPDLPGETVLYYVPVSGKYYHLDPECRKVNARYLPMTDSFTADRIGQEPYAGLEPCDICFPVTGK